MKINKVDRLGGESRITYKELKLDDAFVWVSSLGRPYLCIKKAKGHIYRDSDSFGVSDCVTADREVILVDAEINWCYKNGGE